MVMASPHKPRTCRMGAGETHSASHGAGRRTVSLLPCCRRKICPEFMAVLEVQDAMGRPRDRSVARAHAIPMT
jgi:hypothetical protein